MIKAIWRAAAPGRLGMFIAILSIATLARLAAAVSQGDRWIGSEPQAMAAVVVLWLVLPVFVAMLGTALLRGEHAPWSWGLARPISRLRLLGSLVALDAVTTCSSMLSAWLVLDGFGGMWGMVGGGFGSASPLVIAGLCAGLYMVAAITGTHTSSTVRAAGVAVVIVGMLLFSLVSLVSWVAENEVGSFGLHDRWARTYVVYGLASWSGPGALTEPHTWWLLSGLILVTAGLGGVVLAFLRTARSAPGPVSLSRLLSPSLGLVCLCALPLFTGWVFAYSAAPPEARKGDATLRVTARAVDSGLNVTSVKLSFDGGVVPLALGLAPSAYRGHDVSIFPGLSEGQFEACANVRASVPSKYGGRENRYAEHCVPVVVTDEPLQTLTLDVALEEVLPVARP